MQEIEYKDGEKTKKVFNSLNEAIDDAKEKAGKKPIKKLTITAMIPSRKRRIK